MKYYNFDKSREFYNSTEKPAPEDLDNAIRHYFETEILECLYE